MLLSFKAVVYSKRRLNVLFFFKFFFLIFPNIVVNMAQLPLNPTDPHHTRWNDHISTAPPPPSHTTSDRTFRRKHALITTYGNFKNLLLNDVLLQKIYTFHCKILCLNNSDVYKLQISIFSKKRLILLSFCRID